MELMQPMARSRSQSWHRKFWHKCTLFNRMVAAHMPKCITPEAEREQVIPAKDAKKTHKEGLRIPCFPFSPFQKSANVDSVVDIGYSYAIIIFCRSRSGSPFILSFIVNFFREDLVSLEYRAYPQEFFSTTPWCMVSGLSTQISGRVSPRNSCGTCHH